MSRMPLVTSADSPAVEPLLSRTQAALGRIPNLYAALANSPAALGGYLAFREQLVRGVLPAEILEAIALLVAQHNHCDYCISAHTMRGGRIGMSSDALLAARRGRADDHKTSAALSFCHALLTHRGDVADAVVAAAREAGWADAELLEMVGHVALNVFSNYVNHVARPPLDFPAAPAISTEAP